MNKIYISKSGIITTNGKQHELRDCKFKLGQEVKIEKSNGDFANYKIIGFYNRGVLSTFGLLDLNTHTVGFTDESIEAVILMYIACHD